MKQEPIDFNDGILTLNQARELLQGQSDTTSLEETSRIPTRPRCARCQRYITIDTDADADLWAEVIGPTHGPGYICADCFTRAADERLIRWETRVRFIPISLASQISLQYQVNENK